MIQVKFLEVPAVGKPVRFEHNGRTATSSPVAKCVFGPGSTCQVTTSSGSVYSGPYSQPAQMQPTLYAAQAVSVASAPVQPATYAVANIEPAESGCVVAILCLVGFFFPIIGIIVGAVMMSGNSRRGRDTGRLVMQASLIPIALAIVAIVLVFVLPMALAAIGITTGS